MAYEDSYYETQTDRNSIARSARAEATMNGLRKDSVPTRREYNEKCGEVITYNYGKPITWKEFKMWDNDHRREYLQLLADKYKPSQRELASMFGISQTSVCAEFSALNIKYKYSNKSTPEDKEAWNSFLAQDQPKPVPTEQSQETRKEETMEKESKAQPFSVRITKGEISATGDAADILPSMITYLADKVSGENNITIIWETL